LHQGVSWLQGVALLKEKNDKIFGIAQKVQKQERISQQSSLEQ